MPTPTITHTESLVLAEALAVSAPLTIGKTSYVTASEAAVYLSRRLHTTAWDGADAPTREKALMHACIILDALPWAGDKTDPDQALAFPRDGAADVPQPIKDAQCEMALWLLSFDHEALAQLANAGVRRHMVGPVSFDVVRAGGFHRLPPVVQDLIGDRVTLGATLSR